MGDGTQDEEYKLFRTRLLEAKTMYVSDVLITDTRICMHTQWIIKIDFVPFFCAVLTSIVSCVVHILLLQGCNRCISVHVVFCVITKRLTDHPLTPSLRTFRRSGGTLRHQVQKTRQLGWRGSKVQDTVI